MIVSHRYVPGSGMVYIYPLFITCFRWGCPFGAIFWMMDVWQPHCYRNPWCRNWQPWRSTRRMCEAHVWQKIWRRPHMEKTHWWWWLVLGSLDFFKVTFLRGRLNWRERSNWRKKHCCACNGFNLFMYQIRSEPWRFDMHPAFLTWYKSI